MWRQKVSKTELENRSSDFRSRKCGGLSVGAEVRGRKCGVGSAGAKSVEDRIGE